MEKPAPKQSQHAGSGEKFYTLSPIKSSEVITSKSGHSAEFLRLPKSGTVDPIFSLSRSTWNNLILPCEANGFKPPIKSIVLRLRGNIRGVRLIVADSAREYFSTLVAEADAQQEARQTAIKAAIDNSKIKEVERK